MLESQMCIKPEGFEQHLASKLSGLKAFCQPLAHFVSFVM